MDASKDFVLVEKAGHMLHLQQPQVVTAHIEQFISEKY
jgi:pimeloyl-ACP methyl ester carboxylesterase